MWKVAAWNVNSVKARLDRLLAFLERENPDVVLLQELKCEEPNFPYEGIGNLGYSAAVFGQKAYNGVAIVSKEPATDIVRGFGDGGLDEARFISATVQGVRVASAYIPNGQAVGAEKYHYKLEWLARLRRHLGAHYQSNQKFLLGGDFNVAPEDRDVHDPEAWRGQILFSDPERAALRDVCGFGLDDTFRKHHGEAGHFSWWDYRMLGFPKNRGLRIDFLLATPPLMEACHSARIDRDERKGTLPSDHAPVIAEFKL
ncbi:exodeoxyribonuclease III [bacterium]|nr:exodeoxyribonuclease III [bacterium]